jgi:hypothetical protein
LQRDIVDRHQLGTTLRVAGGWVRNKLLGLPGGDIDIALDNMTGADFARSLLKYRREAIAQSKASSSSTSHSPLSSSTSSKTPALSKTAVAGVGVIRTNPALSKHLETATADVLGVSVDLVNLRREEYDEVSRVPRMVIGTPLEDALRRDFTLNALFYNVQRRTIEDWTGEGLQDLNDRVLRTPLPASQTFIDDPLRVLRALRFAARYSLAIDREITRAASAPAVRRGLARKVSRERIGIEMRKLLEHGAGFGDTLAWLLDAHLADVVFPFLSKERALAVERAMSNPKARPVVRTVNAHDESSSATRRTPATPDDIDASAVATPPLDSVMLVDDGDEHRLSPAQWAVALQRVRTMERMLAPMTHPRGLSSRVIVARPLLFLAVMATASIDGCADAPPRGDHPLIIDRALPRVECLVKGALKMRAREAEDVVRLCNFSEWILRDMWREELAMPTSPDHNGDSDADTLDARMLSIVDANFTSFVEWLRAIELPLWDSAIWLAAARATTELESAGMSADAAYTRATALGASLAAAVHASQATRAFHAKPVLDGNDVMGALKLRGASIGIALRDAYVFQLRQPATTLLTKTDMLNYLRPRWPVSAEDAALADASTVDASKAATPRKVKGQPKGGATPKA